MDFNVTVSVTDVQEPPICSDLSFNIPETALPGSVVGKVEASDQDEGDVLVYSIEQGNVGDAFAVLPDGNITVARPLDFETQSSYTLTVMIADGELDDPDS